MPYNKAWNREYKKKAVTINDVAASAGVSSNTVVRYLAGNGVSKPMRQRVKQAIIDTGYKPTHTSNLARFNRNQS